MIYYKVLETLPLRFGVGVTKLLGIIRTIRGGEMPKGSSMKFTLKDGKFNLSE